MNNLSSVSPILTRLSQNHLNLLETCPRKFQHTYLEQLKSPLHLEQQNRMTWGNQFHLLMQQRELGLPIESLLEEDEELHHSIAALVRTVPELLTNDSQSFREAEHCRTLSFQNYLLTVIYDLLILKEDKAQIFDWKTYLLPENRGKIARNWQTRLYPYVLAETSSYLPEQISLTYWFVKLPTQPQHLTFHYSQAQHEKTRQDLIHFLTQLEGWLQDYREDNIPFPQVPESNGQCNYCSFSVRCQREKSNNLAPSPVDWRNSLDEIEEVTL